MTARFPNLRALALAPAAALSFAAFPGCADAQAQRRPLAAPDMESIARLLMHEDQRTFDDTLFRRLIAASHPEVRRRTAISIARVADLRGMPILRSRLTDADTAVAATVVFAIGQLKDSNTVALFDSLLAGRTLPPTVLTEAAGALGKIRTTPARDALSRFLMRTSIDARTRGAIGEALLSIGRMAPTGDVAAITRWSDSPDEEIRWRATWALFRPRDRAAVARLLELSKDPSALVRSWAVRGLIRPLADSVGLGAQAEAMLIAATSDADRRVRTEAVRTLGTYSDSAALATLSSALQAEDTWISVSAAEMLGVVRNPSSIPLLKDATAPIRPCALRVVALQSLLAIAPAQVVPSAISVLSDTVPHCRTIATQVLTRALNATGASVAPVPAGALTATAAAPTPAVRDEINAALTRMRAARRADAAGTNVLARVAALRAISVWGDSTDLALLRPLADRAPTEVPQSIRNAAVAAADAIARRAAGPPAEGGGRGGGGGGGRQGRPTTAASRTIADYRRITERWVVPDYEGKPRPTSTWTTPKGEIVIELYPGDAPIATDDFVRTIESGAIIGTQFTRVVPDFVNQQESIRSGNTLRDEVSRRRIERTNLSWASAGLDTGTPGYTLNHTPQPHNEGGFTTLGHVVRGMDVVDRTDLGDRVVSAVINR